MGTRGEGFGERVGRWSLNKLDGKQQAILREMHFGAKSSYDLFDFPGAAPSIFDFMRDRFGVISGTHRRGFSITKRGAEFAAKHLARPEAA